MESKDLTNLLASSSFGIGSENNELHRSICEPSEADFLPSNSKVEEDKLNGEITGNNEADIKTEDSQPFEASDNYEDLVDSTTTMQVSVELTEEIAVKEDMNSVHSENGYLAVRDRSSLGNHERDGSPISNYEKDGSSLSGVKRSRVTVDEPRVTVDEQQPSVHVVYNSLSRDSKRKLEELLQKWSEWHARHYSSSHDSNEAFEYGEKTYFPALHVGVDKPSAVTFWMDNQTRNPQSKEFIPLDSNSVPLYDRGYSLGLTSTNDSGNLGRGVEIVDASRCFNCGSYNHSLKECPKPRDNVAVNNARKQQKSRRNQNASSRNPTRYYQNSPGGKYDGLRPGVLDVDTRQLLGLGELDPPPWLKRMREIGYPPGYLDPEDVDQPSGITIFAEEESKEEKEDGEILDTDYPEPPRKMSVEFPGINAPIPENADERRWTAGPSSFDLSRNRSYRRSNHSSEPTSKGHYRDFRDDGPPDCDPGTIPSRSSYSERYGGYGSSNSSYTSYSRRGNILTPRSPSFDRSVTDRGRRSPLLYETSLNYGPASLENRNYDHRRNDYTADSSSHKDKHDVNHRHSRR